MEVYHFSDGFQKFSCRSSKMLRSSPIVLLLCSCIIIGKALSALDQHNGFGIEEPLFLYPAKALAIRNEIDAARVLQSSDVTHLEVEDALNGYLVTRLYTYNGCKDLLRVFGVLLNTCISTGYESYIFTANSTSASITYYAGTQCGAFWLSYVYSLGKSCEYYEEEYVSSDMSFLPESIASTCTYR